MHALTRPERLALKRLPNDAARLAIQRWLELTGADTHSEWRWRAQPPDEIDHSSDLIAAIKDNMREKAFDFVSPMATQMLTSRGPRIWQHSAVSSFLLDRDGRFIKGDFFDRLDEFLNPMTPKIAGTAHVNWLINPHLSNSARLPVDETALVQLDAGWPSIKLRGPKGSKGERAL